jgi:hypothetical protein
MLDSTRVASAEFTMWAKNCKMYHGAPMLRDWARMDDVIAVVHP